MEKIDYEILEHWWEYFLVVWWSIFRPSNERLMGRVSGTENDIREAHGGSLNDFLSRSEEKEIVKLIDFLASKRKAEEERKSTIESKAHSLIGQTGIAVTLLIGALSLGTLQFKDWHFLIKITTWIFFFSVILNLIVAGLHARNTVALKEGYAHTDISILISQETQLLDFLINDLYISEHNSYLNDVKATYLKFAHWFYKCSFIFILISAFFLPPIAMFGNSLFFIGLFIIFVIFLVYHLIRFRSCL
jgi:hypothetical protein